MAEKKETTHILMEGELLIYKRERSTTWQCRFKVDGIWQRASTKERDLKKAKTIARELMIEAEIRKRSNLPVITRRFKDVAKLAIDRMEHEIACNRGKITYNDYIRVIKEYLVPALGTRKISGIDVEALEALDAKRMALMGRVPARSTVQTQNAAINRVFDEAVIRGFLTEANRPKVESKGRNSIRRPAFDIDEIRAMLAGFEGWIGRARSEKSKELRLLLRDYVDVLLDTGARPGDELLNLRWRQVKESTKPVFTKTGEVDEDGEEQLTFNANRVVEMLVDGKTGERTILGNARSVAALKRIAIRNYNVETPVAQQLKFVARANNDDYIFTTKAKKTPQTFQKMFERYLQEHNLLIDPKTNRKRVFYSLRHTYATLALTHDRVPIHTLATQMGTSVLMIERHYSHLTVVQAMEQLRGSETRKLIDAVGEIDEMYISDRVKKDKKQ